MYASGGIMIQGNTFFQAPPTVPGDAEGLSLEGGKNVLGTFSGNPLAPEVFTGDRQIETSNKRLTLQDTTSGGIAQGSFMQLGSDRVLINSGSNNIGLQAIFTDVALQFNLFDFIHLVPSLGLATGFNDVALTNADGVLHIVCNAQTNDFRVDLINNRVIFGPTATADNGASLQVPGDVTTGNPGTGKGKWQLGTKIAAATVFDATHYVEVTINGVVVKLAVVN